MLIESVQSSPHASRETNKDLTQTGSGAWESEARSNLSIRTTTGVSLPATARSFRPQRLQGPCSGRLKPRSCAGHRSRPSASRYAPSAPHPDPCRLRLSSSRPTLWTSTAVSWPKARSSLVSYPHDNPPRAVADPPHPCRPGPSSSSRAGRSTRQLPALAPRADLHRVHQMRKIHAELLDYSPPVRLLTLLDSLRPASDPLAASTPEWPFKRSYLSNVSQDTLEAEEKERQEIIQMTDAAKTKALVTVLKGSEGLEALTTPRGFLLTGPPGTYVVQCRPGVATS